MEQGRGSEWARDKIRTGDNSRVFRSGVYNTKLVKKEGESRIWHAIANVQVSNIIGPALQT